MGGRNSFLSAAVLAFAILGMAAAQPEAQAGAEDATCRSLLDVIDSLDFVSSFKRAINETGLYSAFDRPDIRATVLAPSNGAFRNAARELGISEEELFSNKLALRRIIQNHVIPGKIETVDAEDSTALYATMDFGNYVKITIRNGELFVESQDGKYSSFGTEILHNICNNVKLYIVSKILLPVELENSNLFTSAAAAAEETEDTAAAPAGFFSGFFGGAPGAAGGLGGGFGGATTPPTLRFPGTAGTGAASAAGTTATSTTGFRPFGGLGLGAAGDAAPGGFGTGLPGTAGFGAGASSTGGGLFSGGGAGGGLFSGAGAPGGGLFSGATAPSTGPGAAGTLAAMVPAIDVAAIAGELPASVDPASFTGFGPPAAASDSTAGSAALFPGPFGGAGALGGAFGSPAGAGGAPASGFSFGGFPPLGAVPAAASAAAGAAAQTVPAAGQTAPAAAGQTASQAI